MEDVTKNVRSENKNDTIKDTSTYVVAYQEVDDDYDGDDAETKNMTANVKGPLRVDGGNLIANLVKKKKDGEKEIRVPCEDVEKIDRNPPVSLIRRVDRLYVSRRDKNTIRPTPPGENANANANAPNAPEGERQDVADSSAKPSADPTTDPAMDPGDREDDESDASDDSDDDDVDDSWTRYEDVGIYYWRWENGGNKTEVERVSLADLGEDKDDEEEGTKGEHTMEDTRKQQLARLRHLYRGRVADGGGPATRGNTASTELKETHVRKKKRTWYEHFVSDGGDTTNHTDAERSTFLREHLRAYSPRYELFFRMLENDVVADKRRTPVIVFFRKIRGFSLETLGGFEWYADMRDRRRHADFPALGGTDKQHRYWFLKFTSKDSTEPFAYDAKTMRPEVDKAVLKYIDVSITFSGKSSAPFIAAVALGEVKTIAVCLMFYKMVLSKEPERELELKEGVLTRVRELLWAKVEKRKGEDDDMERDFIESPGKHHVVISVTGDQGENAREWASYLLDESTGAYNHPVNRFGEIVRVMAGADKIGESNDFRSTRHMFFMNPETDVVKLLQKFGRICRSSDPTRYPYYRYGFHRDHLGDDGNEVPIVHYVTLSLPTETQNAFVIIREKAKFYNPYGRLLAREKGDEGLVIRKKAIENDWIRAIENLKKLSFSFDEQKNYARLSNLHGKVEWNWAMHVVRNDDMPIADDITTPVLEWIVRMRDESETWDWENLKKKVDEIFPSNLVPEVDNLRTFVGQTQGPVPTGIVPRLFLNLVVRPGKVGGLTKHVLGLASVDLRDKEDQTRDWLRSRREWGNSHNEDVRKSRVDALRDIVRDKFASGPYVDLVSVEQPLKERQPKNFAGIQIPLGYALNESDDIIEGVLAEHRAAAI